MSIFITLHLFYMLINNKYNFNFLAFGPAVCLLCYMFRILKILTFYLGI